MWRDEFIFFYSSSFALSCRFIWHIFIYHLSFSHSQSQVYIHADRLTPLLLLLNTMGRFQLILDDLVLCCMHTEIFFSNFHLNQLGMWLHSGGSLNISRTNEKCKILIFQKAFSEIKPNNENNQKFISLLLAFVSKILFSTCNVISSILFYSFNALRVLRHTCV
jgi:hypothetical protein